MDIKNEMKIEFLPISENEAFARVAVAAFITQLDPTVDEVTDIKMAVSEAVTNSIIHAYENNNGYVKLKTSITDNTVEIEITDDGKGIENVELAKQPLYTSSSEEERSGMGFTVMETFMDNVKVESELGKGTKISMNKSFKR